MEETVPSDAFDVVILGAGLAGACAAVVFARDGLKVALIDPRPSCLPAFKAEKIEPDQAELFRRLGLLEGLLPHAARVHKIHEAHRGRITRVVPIEQYGILYQDMVNAVRRQIPPSATQRVARAMAIDTGPEVQTIRLDTGEVLRARLVVVAAGAGSRLCESLGLERVVLRASHSLCTGFDVEPLDGRPFPFESLTYWPDSLEGSIGFLTLFPIPGRTRVNLFSFRDPKGPWVRALAEDPYRTISRAMPLLSRVCGPWRAVSRVASRPVDLYEVKPPQRDGLVLLGDAFQSVCPSTGTGVSKVLTDVEALCRRAAPRWFVTPGMGAAKIASFYADPSKRACDLGSHQAAEYRLQFGTARSLSWWLRRRKSFAMMALEGLRGHPPNAER
jgi:2-polyprenyl-6-methoxyphenol hydroxylase-like FAD-dependent oxidoreductase